MLKPCMVFAWFSGWFSTGWLAELGLPPAIRVHSGPSCSVTPAQVLARGVSEMKSGGLWRMSWRTAGSQLGLGVEGMPSEGPEGSVPRGNLGKVCRGSWQTWVKLSRLFPVEVIPWV